MVAVDAETADLLGVLAVMVSMSNSVKYTYMQRKKRRKKNGKNVVQTRKMNIQTVKQNEQTETPSKKT